MFQVAIRLGGKMENFFMSCPCHSEESLQVELPPRHWMCPLTGCRVVGMASVDFNQYIRGAAQESEAELLRELFPDVSVAAKPYALNASTLRKVFL